MDQIWEFLVSGREQEAAEFYDNYYHRTRPLVGDIVGYAIILKATKFLQHLIQEGEELHVSHMVEAIKVGSATIVKLLLQNSFSVKKNPSKLFNLQRNESGTNWLMVSASYGTIATSRLLLKDGYDINDTDDEGMTALTYCLKGTRKALRQKMAKFLLNQGADERIKNCHGRDFKDQLRIANPNNKETDALILSLNRFRIEEHFVLVSVTMRNNFIAYNRLRQKGKESSKNKKASIINSNEDLKNRATKKLKIGKKTKNKSYEVQRSPTYPGLLTTIETNIDVFTRVLSFV